MFNFCVFIEFKKYLGDYNSDKVLAFNFFHQEQWHSRLKINGGSEGASIYRLYLPVIEWICIEYPPCTGHCASAARHTRDGNA